MNLRVRAQLAALFLSFVAGVPAAQAVNCTSISLSEDTSRAKHFSPAAQSYAFGVTVAPSNCTWSVSKTGSVAGFFTLVTTSPQTGNATINFNLTANAADYRSGSIRVGVDPVFQDFNFFQESPNCSYSISPGSASIPANTQFANYTAIVTSSSNGCLWLATTTDSWLETRPGPYQGSGGQFDWDAYPDNTGPARTGTIRAGDFTHFATLTVMQASGCTFSINPTSNAVGAAGTSSPASVAVTAGAGCTWSATSNAPWITMGTGAGSGNGNATYSVAANTGVARTGTLTIAGQTHTVNQAAVVACTFTINPTSNAVAAGGTTTALSVAVTASAPACAWGASSNDSWITVGTGGGNGSGSATYTVGANSGAARSGTLTVAGQTHTVNQAAAVVACTFTISPASNDFPADGTNVPATVAVTASAPGCAWSATSNASWIFVGTGSGNGSGNATYSVTQNLGTAGRTGSLTIAGKTHTVTQAAAPVTACTYTLSPTSRALAATATTTPQSIAVTPSQATCAWTAVSSDAWIIMGTSSGTGNGNATYTTVANSGVARSGSVTVGGATHTVTQAAAGAACTYTINPTSNFVGARGTFVGAEVVVTASAPSCVWAVTSTAPWIDVRVGNNYTGSATVDYDVSENTGAERTAIVTIAGLAHTVTQADESAPCSFGINPFSHSVGAAGAFGLKQKTVVVTASAERCTWKVSPGLSGSGDDYSWITGLNYADTYVGSRLVTYSVVRNPSTSERLGSLIIAGSPHIIIQAGSIPSEDSPYKFMGEGVFPGACVCGDPINLGTGSLFERVTDYSTADANSLAFIRAYNSLGSTQSQAKTLGLLWRSNFDRYLVVTSATKVTVERADGRQLVFNLTGGQWTPDTDVDATLTQSGGTWTFTDGSEATESYLQAAGSSTALLQTIKARNGYTQTLARNNSGQVSSVTDSYNRTLAFTYSNGLLQTFTTTDGLVLTYSYQAVTGGNLLTKVAYSTTPVTSQTYLYGNSAPALALTGIVDENGNTRSTWTYDSAGRALTSQQAGGVDLMTVAYNDTDGSRTVTNALGQQEVYRFTTLQGGPKMTRIERVANGSVAAAFRLITYDANGYTASETDWKGNLTTYVNNARGQPTAVTQASGTPQARTITTTYDTTFVHLPKSVVEPGLTTTFTYDTGGNLLTVTATDTTTTTLPYATSGTSRTTTFTWANFLPASVRGPRTDVAALTTLTYDAGGALVKTTNALNQSTQVTQHLAGGLAQKTLDANGIVRQSGFDARQRLLSNTVTTGNGPLTTTLTYDAAGNVIAVKQPNGATVTNTYDAARRRTAVTDSFNQKVTNTLNALGGTTQTAVADAAAVVTRRRSRSFDALGRVLQDTGGAGQVAGTTYDANGNVLTLTDALGRTMQPLFDVLNRPTQITDATGGITSFVYDAQDHLTGVTDPKGNTTTYVYNGFGELIGTTSPTAGAKVYRYDLAGNLTQTVDGRGAIANHTYDALDRRITISYPANSAENVTYSYDQAGHGFGTGRLTSVADAAGTLSLTYDERGNRLSETRSSGGATRVMSYAYDAASRVAAVTYPSGWVVSYVRDAMGRSTAVNALPPGAAAAMPVVSAITYLPFGPVRTLTYGNGLTETRSYDLDYRLTSVVVGGIAATAARLNLAYGYDAANNVKSIADGVTASNTQSFTYDGLDRLVNAAGGYGATAYAYDKVGNRLTETPPLASAAPALDGLGTITGFTYNQAGRMTTAMAGAQTVAQYTYDAFGRRVAKSQPDAANTTSYQFGQYGQLIEESSSKGSAASAGYIYLDDGRPIATLAPGAGTLAFLHADRRGAPQLATDSSQNVVWHADYQPFGQVGNNTGALVQNLRLPGQQVDAETGIAHNGARDYAPNLGRYLQSDPIGLAGGLNTYAYASANPMTNVDPTGTQVITIADDWWGPLMEQTFRFGASPPLCKGLKFFNPKQDIGQAILTGVIPDWDTPFIMCKSDDIGSEDFFNCDSKTYRERKAEETAERQRKEQRERDVAGYHAALRAQFEKVFGTVAEREAEEAWRRNPPSFWKTLGWIALDVVSLPVRVVDVYVCSASFGSLDKAIISSCSK